jgi:hypothetical protein
MQQADADLNLEQRHCQAHLQQHQADWTSSSSTASSNSSAKQVLVGYARTN